MARIEFRVGGQKYEVESQDRETVLDAALRAAVPAPYSCMEGVCASCRAKIVEGAVEDPLGGDGRDPSLAPGEVLTCQVRIVRSCAKLVVDYNSVE